MTASRLHEWKTLKRDPIVWVWAAVTAALLVPYLVPLLSEEQMESYADLYSDIPLILVAIAAFQFRLRRLPNIVERRFWTLMTLAFVCWLLVRVLTIVLPDAWYFAVRGGVVVDAIYVAFYLFIVLALELTPHDPSKQTIGGKLRSLRFAGAVVFAFGLLIYFAIIPGAMNPEVYDTLVPSLLLYVVLDVYVLMRLVYLRRDSSGSHWETVYTWLLATALLWMVTDSYEALSYIGIVPYVWSGTVLDFAWFPAFFTAVVAARARELQFLSPTVHTHRTPRGTKPDVWRRLPGGLIGVYAVVFPFFHFTLYYLGALDPVSKPAREICTLLFLLLLAGMALLYQRLLEAQYARLEAEREVLTERLLRSQRLEAVGQLTGGIAHDFNNLLTVIEVNLELMASEPPSKAPRFQVELKEAQQAAQRGTVLIRKLLSFSRQRTLSVKVVDLAKLVEELEPIWRRLLPENIEVRFFSDAAVPLTRADPDEVEQIVMNLATNARDAMPNGGVLRVEIRRAWLDEEHRKTHRWGDVGEYVCLSVSDTGAGMDEQTKKRIFEPFFTTKPPGKGTGLGMSMIYGLMKQHSGFVDIQSAIGEGTSVRLYFPVTVEEAPVPVPKRQPEVTGGTETILVIEDEAPIRRAAKRALEQYGYTVLLAEDGAEGLRVFRAHRPEIAMVISDIVMPRMDGPEVFKAIRKEAGITKFMFMSGYEARDVRQSLALDPLTPFLQKPWTITELLVRVREVLDQSAHALI